MFSFTSVFTEVLSDNKWTATAKGTSLSNENGNQEILEWKPPSELTENFPYYNSGFDDDHDPVWIIEFGTWNIRRLMEKNTELVPEFDKYIIQMWQKMYASVRNNEIDTSSEDNFDSSSSSAEGFVVIANIDGYSYDQYFHPPTVRKNLEMFRTLLNMQNSQPPPGLKICYLLNANFAARTLWAAIRSIIGPMASKFDMYGSNSRKWKSVLRRHIPADALPKNLGGTRNLVSI